MLTLNQDDLKKIDDIIKRTPFEFAYPLFALLNSRIQEQQTKEKEKEEVK